MISILSRMSFTHSRIACKVPPLIIQHNCESRGQCCLDNIDHWDGYLHSCAEFSGIMMVIAQVVWSLLASGCRIGNNVNIVQDKCNNWDDYGHNRDCQANRDCLNGGNFFHCYCSCTWNDKHKATPPWHSKVKQHCGLSREQRYRIGDDQQS